MSTALQRSLWWLAAIAVAVIVLLARLQLSFDLSAFFPRHTTLAHEVLIEQVRNGPASRLLVIGVGARRIVFTVSPPGVSKSIRWGMSDSAVPPASATAVSPASRPSSRASFQTETVCVPRAIRFKADQSPS